MFIDGLVSDLSFFPCKEKEINCYWEHLCVRDYDRHFHMLLCYFLLCYFTSFVSSEDSVTRWSWAWTLVSDHLSSNPRSTISWYQFPHQKTNSLLCPWNFPVKNTGLGCHFLLRGIFPTQRLNPGLLHCALEKEMAIHSCTLAWMEEPDRSQRVGHGWATSLSLSLSLLHCRQILYHQSHQGSPNL